MTNIVAPAEAGAARCSGESFPQAVPASAGATGILAGIARHQRPRGPVEIVGHAVVSRERGIDGDYRGAMKGKPYRRQVTLMERADWDAAMANLGVKVEWWERRVNLLVENLDLPQTPGARLRVGTTLLEITRECDPCSRMEEVAAGLKAALTPDWRGGACAMVVTGGQIAVGDQIRIEGR